MRPKGHNESAIDIAQIFQDVIKQALDALGWSVELATFSGNAVDWRIDSGAIFLRLLRTTAVDRDGNQHETWARLFAPAGIFAVPDTLTEFLVLRPADAGGSGAAWAIYGAQLPPQSVTKAVGRWALSKALTMACSAGGWIFSGAHASMPFISIDKSTGIIQLGYANGPHVALDPTNNAIELMVTDKGSPPTPKSVLRLDVNGISMSAGGQVSMQLNGTAGTWTSVGSGFYAAHSGGVLGPAGVFPVVMGPGGPSSIPSTTWKIAG